MPRRSLATGTAYRYGLNGKENDNDVKGLGKQQDYGMRIYDPRLGRFLSLDPVSRQNRMLTPYQFASNRPIDGVDFDRLEYYSAKDHKVSVAVNYNPQLKTVDKVTAYLFYDNVANGLKQKLHSYYKMPGRYWDDNVRVGGVAVGSYQPSFIGEQPQGFANQEGALSETEGKTGAFTLKYESMRILNKWGRIKAASDCPLKRK